MPTTLHNTKHNMKILFNMPPNSSTLQNELFLVAQRWRPSLVDYYPKLSNVTFEMRFVAKNFIPFSSKPIVKSRICAEGVSLNLTVLLCKEMPDKAVRDLVETEIKTNVI